LQCVQIFRRRGERGWRISGARKKGKADNCMRKVREKFRQYFFGVKPSMRPGMIGDAWRFFWDCRVLKAKPRFLESASRTKHQRRRVSPGRAKRWLLLSKYRKRPRSCQRYQDEKGFCRPLRRRRSVEAKGSFLSKGAKK